MKKALIMEPHFGDMELSDKIKVAADFGFDGVEIWDCAKSNAKKMDNTAVNCGVEIVGCIIKGLFENHLNRDCKQAKTSYLESIAYMKDMGCKNVLYFPGNLNLHYDAQKSLLIENLKRLAELANKDDVNIFIQNIGDNISVIKHFHSAGVPGRSEQHLGELDYGLNPLGQL